MINAQNRVLLTKVHFYLLGVVLLNWLLKNTVKVSLNYNLADFLVYFVYLTGLILFVLGFKPFRYRVAYYFVYALTPVVVLLFWMFGGIFLAIIASATLYPVLPTDTDFKKQEIRVSRDFEGFFGGCCRYELSESKFLLLERKITKLNLHQNLEPNDVLLETENGRTVMHISYEGYDPTSEETIVRDTAILIGTSK